MSSTECKQGLELEAIDEASLKVGQSMEMSKETGSHIVIGKSSGEVYGMQASGQVSGRS